MLALSLHLAALSLPVSSLPGLTAKICWHHESGYLPVSDGKQLFYWYHEAIESPQDKPWMLWLNGGPGCSSLGGMFTELGPFVVDKDQRVSLNPYSWNRIANVIFIEQPAGVGFSYPNGKRDDAMTANDTMTALVGFLRQHTELRGRPFYIAGESYGGHYVPNTAAAIEENNANLPAGSPDVINLIGFAVGNGYADWAIDFNANVANGRFHALTSQAAYDAAESACCASGVTPPCFARCFWPRDDVDCPKACGKAVDSATKHAMDGTIDIYDIYEDVCLPHETTGASTARLETQEFVLRKEREASRHRAKSYLSSATTTTAAASSSVAASAASISAASISAASMSAASMSAASIPDRLQHMRRRAQTTISPIMPTCIDESSSKYLNTPAVQQAIHVNSSTIPKGKWSDCGNVDYEFNYASELPRYQKWAKEGKLRILIYNGDADYILSHMGNAAWIRSLQLNQSLPWTMWRGSDGQVAGYFEEFQTSGLPLTFLTVKGAGHMVPKDRPRHALDMLGRFLDGGGYDKVQRKPTPPLCSKKSGGPAPPS